MLRWLRDSVTGVLFAAVLLGFAPAIAQLAAMKPEPEIHAWPRVELTGYIRSEDGFMLFGGGDKRLMIEWADGHYTRYDTLAFACEADYLEAEKNIGSVMKVEAYQVRRGGEDWMVPVVMQVKER
jgi:hypothetical protein